MPNWFYPDGIPANGSDVQVWKNPPASGKRKMSRYKDDDKHRKTCSVTPYLWGFITKVVGMNLNREPELAGK